MDDCFNLVKGLDGCFYLRFKDPCAAQSVSDFFNVGLFCANGFENAVCITDILSQVCKEESE